MAIKILQGELEAYWEQGMEGLILFSFMPEGGKDADIWSNEKQKGVSYADWMDWFWRKPPLKAKLAFEEQA